MKHDFPWLSIGTEVIEGVKSGKLLGSGSGYQLIATKDDDRVILMINKAADLLSKDEQYYTLNMTGIENSPSTTAPIPLPLTQSAMHQLNLKI